MTIEHIKAWFEQAVPEPTDRNRAIQVGVHVEEFSEMLDALDLPYGNVKALSINLKNSATFKLNDVDRVELLDALCDQIVTAIGVAHMYGLDIINGLAEVDKSNWSKFNADGTPFFDDRGKIAKNPLTYTPPNLKPYV